MSIEQAATTDPRVLPRERCVTRYLLDDLAKTQPEKEFAVLMLVILATTSLITLRKGNE